MSIDSGVLTQLEEHYSDSIASLVFTQDKVTSPIFACAEAKEMDDGGGRGFVVRIESYEGAAVGADPAVVDAINNDGAAGGRPTRNRWVVQQVNMDAGFAFSRDDLMAINKMKGEEQFDVITREMDRAVDRIRNRLCQQVSGKGWGRIATTTAAQTGPNQITVSAFLANRFRVGMRLQASTSEDNAALSNSAAQLRVTGVSISGSNAIIALSGNPLTTWTNSQTLVIFSSGDHPQSGNPGQDQSLKLAISGCEAWVDPVNQGTLFGVTRTGDPDLCGLDVDCTGLSTAQGLVTMSERLFYYGRKPDLCVVSGTSWKLLQLDNDVKKTVSVDLGKYDIGFEAIQLPTVWGHINVVPDAFLEAGTAYAGPFNDKELGPKLLHSTKNVVQLDNFDGRDFARATTAGSRNYTGQFFFRGNLVLQPGAYAKARNLPTS